MTLRNRVAAGAASSTAVLRGFTDLVGACADDADRDDLRAAGAKLRLDEAGARPGWLPAGRAFIG
jgi:hypothetical protein